MNQLFGGIKKHKLTQEELYFQKLHEEFKEAKKALIQANENFKNAAPEYIDVAIARLHAAEVYLNTLIREMKKNLEKTGGTHLGSA